MESRRAIFALSRANSALLVRNVVLGRFARVVLGMQPVSMRRVCVMGGLLVGAGGVMRGGFLVMRAACA